MSKRPASDDGGGSAVKKMRRVVDAPSSEDEDAYPGSDIGRGGLTPACADILNKLCDHKHAKPFLAPINEVIIFSLSYFLCLTFSPSLHIYPPKTTST